MPTLSVIVTLIMVIVSLFHFYWALGGEYGLRSAGPSLEGNADFKPSGILIFIVACLIFGLATLSIQLVWPWQPVKDYVPYVGYFVSVIFLIRGIERKQAI